MKYAKINKAELYRNIWESKTLQEEEH